MEDRNLSLDVDWIGHDETRREVARVCVASAHGFTRDGGAPTITIDCADRRTLDAEIARLKSELDAVATRAHEFFGDNPAERPVAEAKGEAATVGLGAQAQLLVRDVMTTDVKTLYRNDELSLVKELMEAGQFRHLVVLNRDEEVAGVISRQDVYYGALAWSLGMSTSMHEKTLKLTTAKSVMRTDVVTTAPDVPIRDAAEQMLANKIGCLPVIDGAKLVGIITESDLLAQMAR